MSKELKVENVVEKILEKISYVGEKFGFSLGKAGRTTEKIVVGIVVIVIFGIAAFFWALFNGLSKKK